jgi:hypothetical protein
MSLLAPRSARDATTHETPQREPNIAVRTPLGVEQINRTLVTRNVDGFGPASMLRNNVFASLSTRRPATRTLANATFKGGLAGQKWYNDDHGWFWRHRRPIIVIGWSGPHVLALCL